MPPEQPFRTHRTHFLFHSMRAHIERHTGDAFYAFCVDKTAGQRGHRFQGGVCAVKTVVSTPGMAHPVEPGSA